MNKGMATSKRCAERLSDGSIRRLTEPSYHGNPIDEGGSLVTFLWGYDLPDLIARWAPFDVEVHRFNCASKGIVAEYSEVIVCKRRGESQLSKVSKVWRRLRPLPAALFRRRE